MSLGTSKTMERMFALTEGVGPGPLEDSCLAIDQPVQDSFRVGEEGVAAYADEQPAGAGLDGNGRAVEAHRGCLDELLTTWFTRPGVAAGGVVGGGGLPAVLDGSENVKLNATSARSRRRCRC